MMKRERKKTQSTTAAAARGVVKKKTESTTAAAAASSYHPPYFEMIKEALLSLNNTNGSTPHAISKYLEEKYNSSLPSNFRKILGIQLKKSVTKGKLIKIKASYKLYSQETPIDEEELQELIRNLKPYVTVPWRKENETVTPKDVEMAMSYGLRRPTEEEKKQDIEYDLGHLKMFLPRDDSDTDQPKGKNIYVPDVFTEEFEETCQKYYNQLHRSEGFEIDDIPLGCSVLPLYPVDNLKDKNLIKRAKKALSCFNDLNGTRFSFVKVERANKHYPYGRQFSITFLAKMPGRDSVVTFQARAYARLLDRDIIDVQFCRIKGM